jgi:hypothetical protein
VRRYGLLYTLGSSVVHPGSTSSSNLINLYGPKPVEGSEGTAAFALFTYAKYTAGTAVPTCSATSAPTTTLTYTYTATTPNSLLSWSSCVSAVLTVVGPYPTAVAGRNAYTLLGASGTRTYTLNGVSSVQSIVGVSDVIGDHTVYDAAPYSIYQGGIAFILSSNATFPGVVSNYNVLYIGDPNNYGFTIETGYERTFVTGVVSSVVIASGSTAPNSCLTNQGGNSGATLTFAWTYSISSPAVNSVFGSWQVCASGQLTVSNVLQFPSNGLALPAYPVLSFSGSRVYTDSRGSTVQTVQSLLGNGNANLAADSLVYTAYPFVDVHGLAFYVDTPVIYANGPYQYNNVTLWPLSYRNTVESYSPAPQVSSGFQVGPVSSQVTCPVASRRVWTWSYTLSGTSSGVAFTICAAGLITTSSTPTAFNGQQAYQVLAINGTRQVTIGSDLSPSGSSTLQNVVGLGSSSVDSADNVVLTSGPCWRVLRLLRHRPAVRRRSGGEGRCGCFRHQQQQRLCGDVLSDGAHLPRPSVVQLLLQLSGLVRLRGAVERRGLRHLPNGVGHLSGRQPRGRRLPGPSALLHPDVHHWHEGAEQCQWDGDQDHSRPRGRQRRLRVPGG